MSSLQENRAGPVARRPSKSEQPHKCIQRHVEISKVLLGPMQCILARADDPVDPNQFLDVDQTPINVTERPANIAKVRGSEKSIQAQSMVTGGLR